MDCSLPGSSVHGNAQERILALLPIAGDLTNPGIKPTSPALAGGFFTTEQPWKPPKQKELLIKYKTIQKQNP